MALVVACLLAFALTGVLALLLASTAARAERRPYRRLLLIISSRAGGPAAEVSPEAPPKKLPFARLLEGAAARVSPRAATRRLARRLEAAGVADRMTPAGFIGLRVVGVLAGLAVAALVYSLLADNQTWRVPASVLVALALSVSPDLWLRDRTESRQREMRQKLPDVLDLLVVSVEAGLGFDAAVARVVRKMEGPLVDELTRVLRDMNMGRTRGESLRAFGQRCQVREISAFVAAICQAEQLGGSIAQALRTQARAIRTRYSQRLREQAAKLPVKMLFPLVLFIFPAIFIILLGPGMLKMIEAFSG